nr:MAG TPA: hypothetical protein [Caudoviricetes sp.]
MATTYFLHIIFHKRKGERLCAPLIRLKEPPIKHQPHSYQHQTRAVCNIKASSFLFRIIYVVPNIVISCCVAVK